MSIKLRLLPLALMFALGASSAQDLPRQDSEPNATRVPATGDDGFTADVFYHVLLGEVALQRGEPAVAARAFLEAARETQDTRLARRATEVAIMGRQRALATDAAKLWSKLDPAADRPKQILAALASGSDQELSGIAANDELRGRLERLLSDAAVNGQGVGEVFLQLNRLFAQQPDKRAVYMLIRDLAQPYPKSAEAHFAVALAALNAGMADGPLAAVAHSEAEKALELRPDWERGALLYSEILSKSSSDQAIKFLEKFIAAQPSSKAAVGALAQQYVDVHRYTDARALMQRLWDREPDSRELEFSVAAIALQMKDYAEAERLLSDLDKAGYGEPGAMRFYLAQLAEETKHYDEALKRYESVDQGDRAWSAKLRIGAMYGKLKRPEDAKTWFASLNPTSVDERVQLIQAQAQVLRDASDDAGAYELLTKGVTDQPEATDLVYDLAMVAERLN
ncbi:MAG TPA: tetratricopeptide repeat protein, partial [Casimicrobiaceae bacterium]|nr:tetratricopeptide repeat protein [Casimicrobiaceae bacterium]